MSDIVERLRDFADDYTTTTYHDALVHEAADEIEKLRAEANSLNFRVRFYASRCEALERWQSRMREPERTVVCDILANGFTLDPPIPADRYELKPERTVTLPPMPEPQKVCWIGHTLFSGDQMRSYATAAMRAAGVEVVK